jgi:hypothetical protein
MLQSPISGGAQRIESEGRTPAIDDDAPMTLAEACTIVFRDLIKPGTLRAEARRGRLTIERIGRRDFVTRAALKEMRELCRTPRAALMSIDQAMPDPNRAKRSIEAALASAVALRQRSKPAEPSKAVAHRVRPKSDIPAAVNPLAKTKRRKPRASGANAHNDLPPA